MTAVDLVGRDHAGPTPEAARNCLGERAANVQQNLFNGVHQRPGVTTPIGLLSRENTRLCR